MKKIFFVTFLLVLVTTQTYAKIQSSHREKNSINFSFTPQWYLNKATAIQHLYIDRRQQVLYPRNTLGYTFDLEYQRITKYGLVFSLGLQAGAQKHDVGIHYNLGYVDEKAPHLKSLTIDTQYAGTVHNAAIRIMVGYSWQSPLQMKGVDLVTKGGITIRQYTNHFDDFTRWRVAYSRNDTLWVKAVGDDSPYFGSDAGFASDLTYAFDLYLGLSKELNWGFVKSLSVGLEATRAIRNGSGSINETLDKYDNYSGALERGEYTYAPKDFALGIRFTVGLWP